MSDHGHDNAHAQDHGHAQDDHGQGGHDDHGHGHAEHWGDYNAQPPAPSTLAPVGALHLLFVAVGLMVLISGIVVASLKLADARPPEPAHHGAGHDKPAHADSHEKKH